jgi:hypothetical protein
MVGQKSGRISVVDVERDIICKTKHVRYFASFFVRLAKKILKHGKFEALHRITRKKIKILFLANT